MALVKCRECGKEVAKSASACPSCGVAHPAGKPTGCVSYAVLLLLALVLFKVCSAGDGKKGASFEGPIEMIGGCCFKCFSYMKRSANDPDSIECVRSTLPVQEGASWTTMTTFRGKNGFGAKVLSTKKFYLQNNVVVDMK